MTHALYIRTEDADGVLAAAQALIAEAQRLGLFCGGGFGFGRTQQHASQAAGYLPSNEQIAAHIPVGHLGTPEDIAAAVGFLCSDQAGFITGQILGGLQDRRVHPNHQCRVAGTRRHHTDILTRSLLLTRGRFREERQVWIDAGRRELFSATVEYGPDLTIGTTDGCRRGDDLRPAAHHSIRSQSAAGGVPGQLFRRPLSARPARPRSSVRW